MPSAAFLPSAVSSLAAVVMLALSCPVASQCPLQWQPGDPIPHVHGDVTASTVWDPDGAGPSVPVLVVGGLFNVGTLLTASVATFDGTHWGAVDTPPLPKVTVLTTWNGQLIAAGGIGSHYTVAAWNGTAWTVLGNTNGALNAMAVFNGDLFVGGDFDTVDGVLVNNVARWNGSAWLALGGGVVGQVRAMTTFGSLHVGGFIPQAGGLPTGNLVTWNGTTWSSAAVFDGPVSALAPRFGSTSATTFLFAGGDFTAVGGVPATNAARFSSATGAWTALPALPQECVALHVRSTGSTTFTLHAAVAAHDLAPKVFRLNGTTWQSLGSVSDVTDPDTTSLAFHGGQLVATFAPHPSLTGTLRHAVRTHDGTEWRPLTGPGFDGAIAAVGALGDDIVVGGAFRRYGTATLASIARGAPGNWQPLGSGITGGPGVFALCTLANGDLVVGGEFTTAGGVAASSIARWNGSAWAPVGNGVAGRVLALLPLPDGGLIAGGTFTTASGVSANRVARWNGTAWSALGAGLSAPVNALCRRANGEIMAAGAFTMTGNQLANRIARWDGATWVALGTGLGGAARALAVLPDDDVVVGGAFGVAGGLQTSSVARWTGSAWMPQSTTTTAWDLPVGALVALPNGDYLAGGSESFFGLGGPFNGSHANLARHAGGVSSLTWLPLALRGDDVAAAALLPNGDVVVGGTFDAAGGVASQNLAVLRPACPAAAASYGSGCSGSGGANVLTETALPWVGATFRGRATGMPASGIACTVTGFTPASVPLSAVLPQGLAGCSLLVSTDLLDVVLPSAGVVATQVAVPASVALAGQTFRQQVIALQLGVAGDLVAATGTNGLALTIGIL